MTDKISYLSAGNELFRWDPDGKLVFVHPVLLREVNKHIDVRMAELEKRVKELEDGPVLFGFGQPKAFEEVPAAPLVPSPPLQFNSSANLVAHIESMFDCRDGDYRAFHTEASGVEHLYTALGVIALDSIPDAQERLRQAMYTAFHKLKLTCKSDRPVLYWRYGAIERIQEDTEKADHWNVPADIRRPERHKIMTRVVIPEADFSVVLAWVKPEGMPYQWLQE